MFCFFCSSPISYKAKVYILLTACKRKDAASTAKAIEKLLTDKKARIQMGANGHRMFKEEFTKEVFKGTLHVF